MDQQAASSRRFHAPSCLCGCGAMNLECEGAGPSRVGVYSLRLGSLLMPRGGSPPTPDCPYRRKEEGLRGQEFQGEEFPQPLGTI